MKPEELSEVVLRVEGSTRDLRGFKKLTSEDFPGGPVVKNPPCNAGDVGSIPGQRTKIPHAVKQIYPHRNKRSCRMQLRPIAAKEINKYKNRKETDLLLKTFAKLKTWLGSERVTGRKARGLQMEERDCRCQTFLSLLSSRKKQTSDISFLLYTNLKGGFSPHAVLP